MSRTPQPNTNPTNPTQGGRPQRQANGTAAAGAAYNPAQGGIFQQLKANLQIQYSNKTYTDKKFQQIHEAIVVFNPYAQGKDQPVEGDYGVRVRCHIPSLYKHLPDVTKQGNFTCQKAALYPEFVAASLEAIGLSRQPEFGEKVKVQLFDHHQSTMHYSNGFVVGTNGSWGSKVRPNLPSPLEVAAKRACSDKNTRFKKIRPPVAGGGVNGPQRSGPAVGSPTGSQPPPPNPQPAPNPSCDVAYVLEQLRNEFYFPDPDKNALQAIRDKIWWHEPTVERIAILHPDFRQTVVDFFVAASKQAKPVFLTIKESGNIRTPQEQREIFFRGRLAGGIKKPGDKPGTFFTVKPSLRDAKGNPYTSTNANEGESAHNYGLAVDVEELSTKITSDGKRSLPPDQQYYSTFSDPNTQEGKKSIKQLRQKGQFPDLLLANLKQVARPFKYKIRQISKDADPPHWEWRSATKRLGKGGGIPWEELIRRVRIGNFVTVGGKKTKYVSLAGFK